MGGTESKRKLVVEDINGEGIVQVSEAVVRRMKGLPDSTAQKSSTEPKKEVPNTVNIPPVQHHRVPKDDEKYRSMKKEIEDFYDEKLDDLQKRSQELQQHSNEQFSNAVKEVEQKFVKYTSSPVCQDLQTKVLECYQSKPDSILDCSPVVNAFTTCVDRARMTTARNEMMLPGSLTTVSKSRSHDTRQAQPVS